MDFQWYWIIPGIVGVLAWAAVALVAIITRYRRRSGVDADAVVSRLDRLDARVAAIEKTLNDIP